MNSPSRRGLSPPPLRSSRLPGAPGALALLPTLPRGAEDVVVWAQASFGVVERFPKKNGLGGWSGWSGCISWVKQSKTNTKSIVSIASPRKEELNQKEIEFVLLEKS